MCSIYRPAGSLIFEVRHINMTGDKFVVNLQLKECSCRKWMLTGLPCTHAIACMQKNNLKVDDYVPAYFRKETYEACYRPLIYPTNGSCVWEVTTYNNLQPPPIRKQPGRPRKREIERLLNCKESLVN
jgi:hypothetical protein